MGRRPGPGQLEAGVPELSLSLEGRFPPHRSAQGYSVTHSE